MNDGAIVTQAKRLPTSCAISIVDSAPPSTGILTVCRHSCEYASMMQTPASAASNPSRSASTTRLTTCTFVTARG